MLSLVLALVLSQPAPPLSPEAIARFEAQRKVLLPALTAKYACEKPGKKASHPLCDVALVEQKGTASEIRGKNTLLGLTWDVKRGRSGKVEVSAPTLVALALNKDSVGVWSAYIDIRPKNGKEKRTIDKLTKDLAAMLEGRRASVERPADLDKLLTIWSRDTNHLVEKQDTAWVFNGMALTLRRVGERWVMVGMSRGGDGLIVSVFPP